MTEGPEARRGFLVPRRIVEETVHVAPRDAARDARRVFRAGDGFEVSIPESVLERAVTFGRAQAPLEWLGLIVGQRCEDARGRHALVLGVVRDVDASGERHFVASSLESEGRIRALVREQFPDCVTLGWIHGHVRHGAAYSSFDFKCQATWTDADSLGIVVDPWDETTRLAVYRGPKGERLHAVVSDAPARGEDLRASDADAQVPGSRTRAPARESTSPGSTRGRGLFAMLVVALLVGLWAGYIQARVSRLEAKRAPASASRTIVLEDDGTSPAAAFVCDGHASTPDRCATSEATARRNHRGGSRM